MVPNTATQSAIANTLEDDGFILSRQWRDTRDGVEFELWVATHSGPVQLLFPSQKVVFFLAASENELAAQLLNHFSGWSRKKVAMRNFSMEQVYAYYFHSQRMLREARELLLASGLSPLESDINPYDRFLMERFILGAVCFRGQPGGGNLRHKRIVSANLKSADYSPRFKVLSLDIETAMQGLSLYSIAVYAHDENGLFSKVFIVSEQALEGDVDHFSDERQLVIAFIDWLADCDPDIIIGWNVINFDMWFLQRICEKHHLPLRIGRGASNAHWRVIDEEGNRRAISVPGRVVLDGIELLKIAAYQFENFSLNNVANSLLNDGKLLVGNDRGEKITHLFLEDKQALADYNVQDCKLVWDIFEKTRLLDFAIARSRLTGLPLERLGGSVASFDFRYLPLMHRKGYVAPNSHLQGEIEHSPGGFVMNSKPGIFDHVLVLDFKSLYPSIIRSFKIDPLGMALAMSGEREQDDLVEGFNGAIFSKKINLLPEIIADLWSARDLAKSDNDSALSQAIKIMMNSFYGVLGTGGCRFFDSKLASSITLRGHQIIQETAHFIENDSPISDECTVIYGDTDSVFVWIKDAGSNERAVEIGRQLERQLNQWWERRLREEFALDCALEIEFETHYRRFLMPTVRGSDQGSKKRYAGVVVKNGEEKIIFKGLENVRTDWTRLSREFQSELYRRVFYNEPYRDYVKKIVREVLSGELDSELVYRKRLRRKLSDYQRNIPPHVQAARKAVALSDATIYRGDWIEYVMTVSGAEPLVAQTSLIDHQHYIDRQLAPAADSILYFLGDSVASIIDQQLGLFG